MGFLDIDNVTKSYGAVEVLHRVDISVEEGEFLVLVGPSGCGKVHASEHDRGAGGDHQRRDQDQGSRESTACIRPKRNIAMVFQFLQRSYPNMTGGAEHHPSASRCTACPSLSVTRR